MQLRQPSRLVADLSHFLQVLRLYPLAMSFVYGIDPDSHLLGGWQLDPIKLKRSYTLWSGIVRFGQSAGQPPAQLGLQRRLKPEVAQLWVYAVYAVLTL